MEFEEAALSVSSSAFFEGWLVKGLDHPVHTGCLVVAALYPAGCLSLYSFQTSDSFGFVRVPYRVDTLSGGRPCAPGLSLYQTHSSGFLRKPRDLRDYIMTTCLCPRTGFRSG